MLLLLATLAAAAVPLRLPPGEVAADWVEPFALTGFAAGDPGGGVGVVIVPSGDEWILRVVDRAGGHHEVVVGRPTNAAAREDVAWLASSLLGSVALPAATPPPPAAPPAAPAPPEPRPAPVARPTPVARPEPEPVAPPPAPVVVADAPPVPAVEPGPWTAAPAAPVVPGPERARPVRLSASLGSSVALRPGVGPAPTFGIDLGVLPVAPLYVGVDFTGVPPAPLTRLGGDRTLADATLAGALGVHLDPPVAARLDALAGVSWRQFGEGGDLVAIVPFPTVGLQAGVAVPLAPWLAVEPSARATVDLRGADLTVDGGDPVSLSPWSVGFGVRLRSTFGVADVASR